MNGIGERPNIWNPNNPTSSEATDREAPFKDFGSSMDAVSLGFVATAILISMFLIMAILEHLLRPRISVPLSRNNGQRSLAIREPHSQMQALGKLRNSHHVPTPNPPDFSVVMPGQSYPTYLAQPAPHPCPREGMYWPSHDNRAFTSL